MGVEGCAKLCLQTKHHGLSFVGQDPVYARGFDVEEK